MRALTQKHDSHKKIKEYVTSQQHPHIDHFMAAKCRKQAVLSFNLNNNTNKKGTPDGEKS
jgi:hypothetical protein